MQLQKPRSGRSLAISAIADKQFSYSHHTAIAERKESLKSERECAGVVLNYGAGWWV